MTRIALSLLAASCMTAGSASASLVINLTLTGVDDVTLTVSGFGTISGSENPGGVLNFDNFTGTPFGDDIDNTDNAFGVIGTANITGLDGGTSFPYASTIGTIDLNNGGLGGADINFDVDYALAIGDTFEGVGSSTVTGLSFSDLNPGTYTSTAGDSDEFGGVTLNIVPEPTTLALIGLGGLLVAGRRRRR